MKGGDEMKREIEINEPMVGNQTMREYLKMFGHSDCEIEKAIKNYYELPKPVFNFIKSITDYEKNKIGGAI